MKQNAPARVDTEELLRIVQESCDLPSTLEERPGDFNVPAFHAQLAELTAERGLTAAELGKRALLSRSFAYQLTSGERAPSRDIVLDETQRLLRAAQRGALYPRVQRDAAVIYALARKLDLSEADELLTSIGETSLV